MIRRSCPSFDQSLHFRDLTWLGEDRLGEDPELKKNGMARHIQTILLQNSTLKKVKFAGILTNNVTSLLLGIGQ